MADPTRKHQWVEGNRVVPWEHCYVCGIIRRRDDKNSPCKGFVRIVPKTDTDEE